MTPRDFHTLYPWARNDGKKPYAEVLFSVDLPVSRAELWPFITDTSRFNRALGFGRRFEREENARLVVQEKFKGMLLEWVEHPWTWLFESHAIAEREYRRGPFLHFRAIFHVLDNPKGGVTLCVQFAWVLKSRVLAWILEKIGGAKVKRDVKRLMGQIAKAVTEKRRETEMNPYLVCRNSANLS